MENLAMGEVGESPFIEPITSGGAPQGSEELRPESQATTAVHSGKWLQSQDTTPMANLGLCWVDSDRFAERRTIGHSSNSTVFHGESIGESVRNSVGESYKAGQTKPDKMTGNECMKIPPKDSGDDV